MGILIKIFAIVCIIILVLIAALAILSLLELVVDKLTDFVIYVEDLLEDIIDSIKERKRKKK